MEKQIIKKEICDIMEGDEQAFDMRSKRYKFIKKMILIYLYQIVSENNANV